MKLSEEYINNLHFTILYYCEVILRILFVRAMDGAALNSPGIQSIAQNKKYEN